MLAGVPAMSTSVMGMLYFLAVGLFVSMSATFINIYCASTTTDTLLSLRSRLTGTFHMLHWLIPVLPTCSRLLSRITKRHVSRCHFSLSRTTHSAAAQTASTRTPFPRCGRFNKIPSSTQDHYSSVLPSVQSSRRYWGEWFGGVTASE